MSQFGEPIRTTQIAGGIPAAAAQAVRPSRNIEIDDHPLNQKAHRVVGGIGPFTEAAIQVTNRLGVTWASGVMTVKRSVTGRPEDAIDFSTPVTISAAGITQIADLEGAVYLHFVTTTLEAASGEVQIHIHLSANQAA